MAASPLLQIRRVLERRSSADVSLSFLAVLLVGSALWAACGTSLGNLAIVIPNAVAIITQVTTILIALRFRSRAA